MKHFTLIVILILGMWALPAVAGDPLTWHTDLDQAKAVAQKENKPLFLFFTGSDWCSWCKRLNAQILSQSAFQDYAAKDLVLVKIDFLRYTPMEEKQKEYNNSLARQYQVQGFPTVMLLSPQGAVLGRTGYQDLSPQGYVEHLKSFVK